MKKPILIAPRNAAREMTPGPDTERLLASGSWVTVVKSKPHTRHTKNTEAFRQRKREQGFRPIYVFLPGTVFEELHAQQRKGESIAELIERLLSPSSNESKTETHK
ncbi:MAG: hypothetical protein HYZ18_15135 [Pseudogulbenkiania sp.]|nr:hypothetical protein [Pseudogulbenkiania sp.]